MKISAVEREIGRWAEGRAEEVGVSDGAREDDSDCGGAGKARKCSALEGK